MLFKAAINGGRTRAEHAAIPISPDEQAAAAVECLQAGADAVHLHVRSTSSNERPKSEQESLDPEDVSRTLSAVLAVCPKFRIGVSTGAWILPDTAQRLQAIAAWEILPGFASVNFIEDGAAELSRLLLSKGVEVEAGLSDAKSAEMFCNSGLVERCLRILFEPQEQEIDAALKTVSEMEEILNAAGIADQLPRLLHGTEATAWPLMDAAISRGYGVRIGFEDSLVLPDDRLAQSNRELVMEARSRMRAEGNPEQEAGAGGSSRRR